ncbi:MAG: DUF308 domain-containing protein [Chloroflexota bacterium]
MTALSSQDMAPTAQIMKKAIADNWWILLIRGLATLFIGLLLFGHPAATLVVLAELMGIYWVVNGLFSIVAGITGRTDRSRTWLIVGGILGLLAGLFVISRPLAAGLLTTTLLVYMLAFGSIFDGIAQIFAGRETEVGAGREWSWGSFFLGILNVVVGVLLLGSPLMGDLILLTFIPVLAIIGGIILIILSFQVRKLGQDMQPELAPEN